MYNYVIVKAIIFMKDGKSIDKLVKKHYKLKMLQFIRYRERHLKRMITKEGDGGNVYFVYKQKLTNKEYRKELKENPLMCEK
jgi:hypothetical protein